MSYHAFFLATRWGRREGGLNVFNTGLTNGAAEVLKGAGRCYCLTEGAHNRSAQGSVQLLTYEDRASPERTAEQICRAISESGETDTEVDVVIIGHDVHTGQLAIECTRLVGQRFRCGSAVVRHMHYRQYGGEKGVAAADLEAKAIVQEEIVDGADLVFAVGPLLTETTHGRSASGRSIVTLIPGAPRVTPKAENPEAAWQIFMSGRLGAADDRIKNATLAIEGLRAAYDARLQVSGPASARMGPRGTLRLFGSEDNDAAVERLRSRTGQFFDIVSHPYSEEEEAIFVALSDSHFAMMPSWHEGFGLTGWEAVCAGVPLICSRHSGLYQFLERSVWAQHPAVPKDSVFSVELVGRSPDGECRPEDIQSIATAILEFQRNAARAKAAALNLSEHLREHYTWAGCARTLIDALSWPLSSSMDWRDRQRVAARREPFVQPERIADDDLIKDALTIVREGRAFSEWQRICTALNLLSSRGKVWRGTQGMEALRDTQQISAGIEAILAGRGSYRAPVRISGELDVIWRLMGAASSVATTLAEFNALVGPELWKAITSDEFLVREFFYYSCRYSQDFPSEGEEILGRIRSLSAEQRREDSLQVRLGRLSGRFGALRALLEEDGILAEMPIAATTAGRVESLIRGESAVRLHPQLAADSLWLMPEVATSGVFGPLMTLDYIGELQGREAIPRRWRGDRRFEAAALLGSLPVGSLMDTLQQLAQDEDESLRWACLDLCFSRALRDRLSSGPSQFAPEDLRRRLGGIVDDAVRHGDGHPWVQREFLRLYSAEVADSRRNSAGFTLEDFPFSRRLLGSSIHEAEPIAAEALHPEVTAARTAAREKVKRILLVLPPIQIPETEGARSASYTTTPALGLGLIASALANAGHDVQLVDCHRFPDQVRQVIDRAASFDWLGLNVVLSTVRSAYQLIRQVRDRSLRPMIVVGGPAINLGAWRGGARVSEQTCWDFEVRGDGEHLLAQLVSFTDSDGPWPEIAGVSANLNNPLLAGRCAHWIYSTGPDGGSEAVGGWSPPVLIDRRFFRGEHGPYEPAPTRRLSGGHSEAHVVMSRGCDWNCNFCTERFSLSGGERRREVGSVLSELRRLGSSNRKIHVQFIDDNLLPQIARTQGDTVGRARCLDWAERFLSGLVEIRARTNPAMGWRGIFRIEDFLLYEQLIPDFIGQLRLSGCQMLAFGVEHGSEVRRQKLKGSTDLSNVDIQRLFSRLRSFEIDTKGYFILGGHKETEELGLETIHFAIESGVTLAYFALFKDFVKASNLLKRNAVTAAQTADEYLTYEQLWLDLDEMFAAGEVSDRHSPTASNEKSAVSGAAQGKIYRQLHKLGFSFSDLVKYNDYHSDAGTSGARTRELYYGDADAYANVVRRAYSSFYLRSSFVSDYRRLVARGY